MTDLKELVTRSYTSHPKYTEIRAGLPEDYQQIKTLRDLLEINYKIVGVKEQLRKNLISKMQRNQVKYPGIIGFDQDVIPALDRAILSCHDILLIGQIGQAKTKISEIISKNLLSPMPIIKNSLTNDCPMDLPQDELISLLEDREQAKQIAHFYVSPESSEKIRNEKLDTPIEWLEGHYRYRYVLATPDISVKDLVGYIDAVKVAKRGIEMYKIESYSPGQLMQAKHGIFCIDELPVLDPRKQVALLSILQEGKFTTGAYPVIFEPRTMFFTTANPIDYTHSGKIIEPLYDRLKSHIHTHYPTSIEGEMLIIMQEASISKSFIPVFILKTLARIVQNTRKSDEINQEKGISVRLGVHGLELLVGEAERTRALSHKILPVPRLCDVFCLEQVAKFELTEIDDTEENRSKVFRDIITTSVKETAVEYLDGIDPSIFEEIKRDFVGKTFHVSQQAVWKNSQQESYKDQLSNLKTIEKLVNSILQKILLEQKEFEKTANQHQIKSEPLAKPDRTESELKAAITEIVLEGLCCVQPKILDRREASYVSA
ncbi:MAG: sigma 54-interacting transcriptional regulator [Nitrosopumilaceae archaeon]